MDYFEKCKNIEDVKSVYKKLVKQYHPDINPTDTTAIMQSINTEYETAFNELKNKHSNANGETYTADTETTETPKQYADIINKLIILQGLNIEIIGSFIWVGGETFVHRETLKELKFRWSNNKKMWYKAPENYHKKGGKSFDIDEIRETYGSQKIKNINIYALA